MFKLENSDWDDINTDLTKRADLIKAHIEHLRGITPAPESKDNDIDKNNTQGGINFDGNTNCVIGITLDKDGFTKRGASEDCSDSDKANKHETQSSPAPTGPMEPPVGNIFNTDDKGLQERIFALASTDVLVDIAQVKLSKRATQSYRFGVVCVILTVLTLIIAIVFALKGRFITPDTNFSKFNDISGKSLTIIIFEKAATGGLFLLIAYYFATLSKSFLHEAA